MVDLGLDHIFSLLLKQENFRFSVVCISHPFESLKLILIVNEVLGH